MLRVKKEKKGTSSAKYLMKKAQFGVEKCVNLPYYVDGNLNASSCLKTGWEWCFKLGFMNEKVAL